MNRLTCTLVALAIALGVLGVGAPADAAAKHTRIAITGWDVLTFDHNYEGTGPVPVANHGTFVSACADDDPPFAVYVNIKGRHVKKHGAYWFKATYNGAETAKYHEHWSKNGTQLVQFAAVNDQPTLSTSGKVVVTFYIGTKKVATNWMTVSDQACQS